MTDWGAFFRGLPEEELEAIALLRVIECTNGCIQHSYRANHPKALTIEQTRTAMGYSMGIMKTMEFELAGTNYYFCDSTKEQLQRVRKLYVKAFKQNDDTAEEEFMRASVACAECLGENRIRAAGETVTKCLSDTFPGESVKWGVNYLLNLTD